MLVDEAKLTQYALGILDEEECRIFQKEIEASPTLQKELASIRNALQQLALAEKPISSDDQLRNKVLGSIRDKTRFSGFIERFASLFDLDKQISEKLLAKIDQVSSSDWESTLIPGVKIMKFTGGSRVVTATCGIVQVKSGNFFPAHQHQGEEKILVLQGVARDDNAKEISAGDMFSFPKGSRHSFRIIGQENFIFAVVLYKKNKLLFIKTLFDLLRIKK